MVHLLHKGIGIAALIVLLIPLAAAISPPDDPFWANTSAKPQIAPINAEFSQYLHQAKTGTCSSGSCGLVPSPVEPPKVKAKVLGKAKNGGVVTTALPGTEDSGIIITGLLPATFDLRTENRVTGVRNQGSCGSCWAFATMGSLESTLMPGTAWDFSENNLKNLHGYDLGPCSGGNAQMSTAYLPRGSGPVTEVQDPYSLTQPSPTNLLPAQHVQDVITISGTSGPTGDAVIKQAIVDVGGVYTHMYYDGAFYRSTTAAYYQPPTSANSPNHAVTLVGWDDAYSRNNFMTEPAGDGAWIVRNSWGSSWGQQGYFYLSYYDRNAGVDNAIFTAEPTTSYDAVYQYDPLGQTSYLGYGTTNAGFANVFTATQTQEVTAVGFYAHEPSTEYTVEVYRNPASGPINALGPAVITSGTLAQAGFHTVTLPAPVSVTQGERFSVVVQIRTPGYNYPVPLEGRISGYTSAATASAGQSYITGGSTWTDITTLYPNDNVCLKAYVQDGSTPPGPNTPPVAAADSYTTAEDTVLGITAPGILANDMDAESSSLSAILVTPPSHGTLTLNPSGSFTYTPVRDYSGTDSFTYRCSDGLAASATATVTITVTAVNDVPVAAADSYSATRNTPLTIAAPGILANDRDPEGSALTAVLTTTVRYGTLSLHPDGSFTYTPRTSYTGTDSFTYSVSDGSAQSAPVKVTITVKRPKK